MPVLSQKKIAERMRRHGRSLNEISEKLSISKSTASLWCRGILITKKGQERLQSRKPRTIKPTGGRIHAERRIQAFTAGKKSRISALDALGVGLYWGDGSKSQRTWTFTNSNFEAVQTMIKWAIRAGQKERAFRAVVIVHVEDTTTETEVINHWAKAGIPEDKIIVTRVFKKSKKKHQGRLPFGTCHLSSLKNGAWLYSYWEGQLAKLKA